MEITQEYELDCRYDSRNSFYGKAIVEKTKNKNVEDYRLYSYGTLVARITIIGNITTYYYFGKYSQTTTRHQKEFFRQFGLSDREIKELWKNGEFLVKGDLENE